jgi:GNAT superfamily N-acetyltransferase
VWDWAEEMARSSVDQMDDEQLGLDSYREEALREEAAKNVADEYPNEDEFYVITDPNGNDLYVEPDYESPDGQTPVFDSEAYDAAMETYHDAVDSEYETLLDLWRQDARESMIENEQEYYAENASDYDYRGDYVYRITATDHNGHTQTYDASEMDSGSDNALENVIGPDLAQRVMDGETVFEGDNLMAGENAKSALGASHFYDNKLTGFVNKFLKKTGVQTTHEEIGSAGGPFRLRVEFSSGNNSFGRWVLQGRGDYPFSNYFDAINAQHKEFGDIPRPVVEHDDRGDVWVRWQDFPKEAKVGTWPNGEQTNPTHGRYIAQWGGTRWGPYDSVERAAMDVEDMLIHAEAKHQWGTGPGSGTVVHSIPVTDEVRAFVDQGIALFQHDPLVQAIKKEHGLGEPNQGLNRFSLHERMGNMPEQAHGDIRGAVVLGGNDGSHISLFRGANATTPIHELGHIIQQYAPDLGLTPEEFARTFEQYVIEGHLPSERGRLKFRALAKAMRKVYKKAPESVLNPATKAMFDHFFYRVEKADPKFAAMAGIHPQEDNRYTISDVQDGNAETFWHTGDKTTVGRTETLMSTGGAPAFHLHVHDEHGNLVGAQHGFLNPDDNSVYASSVYVHPDHQGQGLSTRLHGKVMDFAEANGLRASAVFKNRELGARTEAQARARGRNVETDPETGLTYFQEDDSLANTHEPMGAGTPEQQLRRGLKGARQRYGVQKAARHEELKRRAEAVDQALRTIEDPDEAMNAARAAMRGELPKIELNGAIRDLDADTLRELKKIVNKHPTLPPFAKINLNKAINAAVLEGRVPAPHEMRLIETVFGKNTARAFAIHAAHGWGDMVINALNIPRSLMATADLSALARQSLVAMASHPLIWGRNVPVALKSMFKPKYYERRMEAIKHDPLYNLSLAARVSYTDISEGSALIAHEEAFASDYAAKALDYLPVPNVIKGSARAYTGFLNTLRLDLFKNQVRIGLKAGTDVHNEKWLKDIGDVVNAATGRGTIHGRAEHILPALNTVFFSPRLMLSRINYLDPTWYIRLSKQARREALRGLFATAGSVMTALWMASQIPGVEVGSFDPHSADFGKLKLGNTRIDVAGGFQQYVRLAMELLPAARGPIPKVLGGGYKVSTTTGETQNFDGKFGSPTRLDEAIQFFLNKTSPAISIGTGVLRGTTPTGDPVTPAQILGQNFTPLLLQDARDVAKEHGGLSNDSGLAWALGAYGLGSIGVSLQTYKPKTPGAKQEKQLVADAKAAGLPDVPKQVLIDFEHKAALDNISQHTQGDEKKRAKRYIDYYAKTTGDHSFDRYKALVATNADAQQIMDAIRQLMVGSGVTEYEKAIRDWKKAQ